MRTPTLYGLSHLRALLRHQVGYDRLKNAQGTTLAAIILVLFTMMIAVLQDGLLFPLAFGMVLLPCLAWFAKHTHIGMWWHLITLTPSRVKAAKALLENTTTILVEDAIAASPHADALPTTLAACMRDPNTWTRGQSVHAVHCDFGHPTNTAFHAALYGLHANPVTNHLYDRKAFDRAAFVLGLQNNPWITVPVGPVSTHQRLALIARRRQSQPPSAIQTTA